MPRFGQHLLLFNGGSPAATYDARVLATSPLRYNKLNSTSGTSIVDSSGNGYTGTYSGVSLAATDSPFLPDKAPSWDGVNDSGDLYSAAFNTAFNPNEFTVMLWVKVASASVWTDATVRGIVTLRLDANNRIAIARTATNNTINFRRAANSVDKQFSFPTSAPTAWFSIAISASIAGGGLLAAGDTRGYINGAQVGTTQTGSNSWAGSGLSSTETVLGAVTNTGSTVWNGFLSRLIIWNSPMSSDKLALMTA